MKIAFVNDGFLLWRGGDHPIFELASRLNKKHEVYVIAPEIDYPGTSFRVIQLKGGRLVTQTWRDFLYFYNLLKFRKEIKKIIKKENYDIICVFHSSMAFSFLGIKNTLFVWQGSPPETISERGTRVVGRWFLNRINLFLLNSFKKTIVISDYLSGRASLFLLRSKIIVIGEGVEKGFCCSKIDKEYIVCQGRHESSKKIDEVIRLSAKLKYPVKIIGRGSLTSKLKILARQLKAPVEFYSNIPAKQKIKLFKESSFFISASRWEGFGLPFLEAQRCGKPVVGYKLGSIPEIVKEGETGFLVDNYQEFLEGAKKLINDKKLRIQMGKAAYKFSRKFDWDKIAKEYEKVFYLIASS